MVPNFYPDNQPKGVRDGGVYRLGKNKQINKREKKTQNCHYARRKSLLKNSLKIIVNERIKFARF